MATDYEYEKPQVKVYQSFTEVPTTSIGSQPAFVFGPEYLLFRYEEEHDLCLVTDDSKEAVPYTGDALQADYPGKAGAVDTNWDRMAVYAENADYNTNKSVTVYDAGDLSGLKVAGGYKIDLNGYYYKLKSDEVTDALEAGQYLGPVADGGVILAKYINAGTDSTEYKYIVRLGAGLSIGLSDWVCTPAEVNGNATSVEESGLATPGHYWLGVCGGSWDNFGNEDSTSGEFTVTVTGGSTTVVCTRSKSADITVHELHDSYKLSDSEYTKSQDKINIPAASGEGLYKADRIYVQFRQPRDDHASSIDHVTSIGEVGEVVGQVDPSNPLAYGVYMAKLNSGKCPVYFLGTRGDDKAAFEEAIRQASLTSDIYQLVPMSDDQEIFDMVEAHLKEMSSEETKMWRIAWISAPVENETYLPEFVGKKLELSPGYEPAIPAQPMFPDSLFPITFDFATSRTEHMTIANASQYNLRWDENQCIVTCVHPDVGMLVIWATDETGKYWTESPVSPDAIDTCINGVAIQTAKPAINPDPAPAIPEVPGTPTLFPEFVTSEGVVDNTVKAMTDLHAGDVITFDDNSTVTVVSIPANTKIEINKLVPVTGGSTKTISSITHAYTGTQIAEQVRNKSRSFSDRRMYNTYPDRLHLTINGEKRDVAGYFGAAACAGLCSSTLPQQPLTNMDIEGIHDVPETYEKFDNLELNVMASGGTFIIMQDLPYDRVYVRHQLSTATHEGNLLTRELSITKNVDSVSYYLAESCDDLIGKYNICPELLRVVDLRLRTAIDYLESNTDGGLYGPQLLEEGTEILSIAEHPVLKDHVRAYIVLNPPKPFNVLEIHLTVI